MNTTFQPITSASNPHIKRVQALLSKARTRREEQAFVIEGLRLFMDTPSDRMEEIFVSESLQREIREPKGFSHEDAVYVLPDDLFSKISDTKTPQGILAVVKTPVYTFEDLLETGDINGDINKETAPFLLILENIQDPGNLGTMFRTAEAAGVTGILMSQGTVDITNPKTVRATMSSIFRVPFLQASNEQDFKDKLQELKSKGINLVAAHLKGEKNYDELDMKKATGLLIGNEGNGLTEETTALADTLTRIPMQGEIESLNAAMAAGILMYEVNRQRR